MTTSNFQSQQNLTPSQKISSSQSPGGGISFTAPAVTSSLSSSTTFSTDAPVSQAVSNNSNQPSIVTALAQNSMITKAPYCYPPDLNSQYKMVINFAKYSRPNALQRAKFITEFSVAFPLPNTMQEPFDIKYSVGDAGPLIGALSDQLNVGKNFGNVDDFVSFMTKNKTNISRGAKVLTGGELLKVLGSDINNQIEQSLGAILNPHPSVFFKGVNLRVHHFNWTFAPQSQQDSLMLKGILDNMKYRILPRYEAGMAANVLDYPYMVAIKLSPPVYEFKRAVISNILINYTPRGTPAFFKGTQMPALVSLALVVQEIEYFTADNLEQDVLAAQGNPPAGSGHNVASVLPFLDQNKKNGNNI